MRPARVTARGWGWRHSGRRAPAVHALDLDIAPGERVLLLGPSGAGKSTLLAGLAGVLGDAEDGDATGSLLVDGAAPSAARGRAGLVLQDPESQTVMSRVGDEVAFGAENLAVPREEIWPRVAAALDVVGLPVALDHPTSELSGGQKQRLAIAAVLAMRPGLLLLDEPTANLDPAGARAVRDAVRDALDATGATAVIVEHRVALWLDVVDRVVVLGADGSLLADGPAGAVLEDRAAGLAEAGVWLPGRTVRPLRPPRADGEPLLEARQLDVARDPQKPLGLSVDLDVRTGEVTVISGSNGSGKTTLALTLAGLLPPVAGRLAATPVLAAGAGESPIRWRSRELLSRMGTVFQSPDHQFLAATVRDELALGPRALRGSSRLSPAEIHRRVDELLEVLSLGRLARANPFTLSGGQRRRLSVGTALATRPSVLVLDEPTFGQDSRTWSSLVRLLGDAADDGAAVVAASHDPDVAIALSAAGLRLGDER